MEQLPLYIKIIGVMLTLWTIPWKIYAVWTAVKHDQKKWFVVLILLNTIGILEIYYIFKVAKKSWTEVKGDFSNAWALVKK
jgi:hypothetical protein